MDKHCSEKCAACKDGGTLVSVNARLTDLVGAFDRLGFRVLKAETNGMDFDLKIRDLADSLEVRA